MLPGSCEVAPYHTTFRSAMSLTPRAVTPSPLRRPKPPSHSQNVHPVTVHEPIVLGIEPIIVRTVERRLDGEGGAGLAQDPGAEDSFLLVPDRDSFAPEGDTFVQLSRGTNPPAALARLSTRANVASRSSKSRSGGGTMSPDHPEPEAGCAQDHG